MTETEALVSQLREQADRVSGLFTVCDLLCRAADALEARSLDSEDLDWLEKALARDDAVTKWNGRWLVHHFDGEPMAESETLRQAIRAARAKTE